MALCSAPAHRWPALWARSVLTPDVLLLTTLLAPCTAVWSVHKRHGVQSDARPLINVVKLHTQLRAGSSCPQLRALGRSGADTKVHLRGCNPRHDRLRIVTNRLY